MKRFWVFVIICVVALGIGFTVFRFMTREEILYVNQTVFEVNRGETKKIELVKKNLKSGHAPKAEITNTSIVEWTDEENFVFKAKNGGTTTIIFTSDLDGFSPVTVQVTVGDGNSATPFFIKNEEDLAAIGETRVDENEGLTYIYPLSANYKLVADLSKFADGNWKPLAEGDDAGFTGTFDFNGHTISNLTITSATGENAGLFAMIGKDGSVVGANMINTKISANVANAGAVAGVNYGKIESGAIANVNIVNAATGANIGGVVGKNHGTILKTTVTNRVTDYTLRATGTNSCAGGIAGTSELMSLSDGNVYIGRCGTKTSVSAEAAVGGIVGKNIAAAIENCYAGSLSDDYILNSNASAFVGGIAGLNTYKDFEDKKSRAYLADTYSVMKYSANTSTTTGAIIGKNNNADDGVNYNIVYGNYYSKDINSNLEGIASDVNPVATEVVHVHNKTVSELKKQTTYFSYVDTDHGSINKFWQFDEGAWMINEDASLPELAFVVNFVSPRVYDFVNPEAIRDANDFMTKLNPTDPSKFNAQMPFSLEADIRLKSTDGFIPFEFNGCLDGNGYTIYLEITTPEGVVDGYTGLFTKLGAGAKLRNIKVDVKINSILTADHIGAIAAYNNGGSLDNCSATGIITTDKATATAMYIAGLVGENRGYISNSTSDVAVTYEKSPTLVYIGGIAGYSTGAIQNSKNTGLITAKNKTEAYVGGIVGWTSGTITKCSNHGEITGEVEAANAYYGGIAGILAQNAEAKMTYCSSYEPVTGSNAGGLVGISIGAIEYCYSSARVTGIYIGGLAYNIKQGTAENRSYIKNSMTDNSILYGDNDKAVVCGVVYQIDVCKEHLCYCEKVFTSCKFQGAGKKYYESQSNIRGIHAVWNPSSAVDMDAFNNCLYVTRDDSIIRSDGDFSMNSGANWNYQKKGKPDCPISEEQAKGSDGYRAFTDNNYSTDFWTFEEGSYPMVKGVAA